jgi:hypothetical protein
VIVSGDPTGYLDRMRDELPPTAFLRAFSGVAESLKEAAVGRFVCESRAEELMNASEGGDRDGYLQKLPEEPRRLLAEPIAESRCVVPYFGTSLVPPAPSLPYWLSAAPPGTLFDYASVHIMTTATLQRFKDAYPEGQITIQRFRPNIVVDSPDETGFVENSWPGRTLTLGTELVLRVSIPCPRCVMTTLPQADLPHDPRILRTLVDQNRLDLGDFGHLPCAGVYADVVQPGSIRRGDRLQVGD